MLKKRKINKTLVVGWLIVLCGIGIGIIPFFNNEKEIRIEENKIEEFFDEEVVEEIVVNESATPTKEENTSKNGQSINYSMVLEIPKINLKKGLYDKNSKYNSVKYNIQILKESDMPNVVNGNLILASHRGNSSISYFNNLYKLSNGNQVYVYYNNVKYIYEITNMYEVEKTGTITIHRNRDETVIVLITCKKNENKQLVFIGNLVDKEDY